ncbi:MAG: hypothetical protein AAB840_02215 [Patescibacteria group bacterium]
MFWQKSKLSIYTIVMIVAVVFVGGYAVFQARKIVSGPSVDIKSPQNGEVVYKNPIEIYGVAKNINAISVNDRPIFIDENGIFKEKLLLYLGYNIVEINAKDRFGKETTKRLEIVLENSTTTATSTSIDL